MKTERECLPCFYGQITRTLSYAGIEGEEARRITQKAEAIVEAASMHEVPARTTTVIHRMLRGEAGIDPFRKIKDIYNAIALEKLPLLRRKISATEDCLEGGVRAAIAGNVIDFGIYESIDLDRSIDETFLLPLSRPDYRAFARAADEAHRILYLCDNAGELVFDRPLIETLQEKGKSVTVAVKGSPVINDATRDDAEAAGLTGCARVIDNGNDGIGTLLEACSPEFMDSFRSADLIISKGQANYETLVGTGDNRIFFLFKVKCPVVARDVGRENGDIVLMRNVERIPHASRPDAGNRVALVPCGETAASVEKSEG